MTLMQASRKLLPPTDGIDHSDPKFPKTDHETLEDILVSESPPHAPLQSQCDNNK